MARSLAAVCLALAAAAALAEESSCAAASEEEQALLATKTVVKKHEANNTASCTSVNPAPDSCGDCKWMLNGGDDGNDVNKCACRCRKENPSCTNWNSKCAPCWSCQGTGPNCGWMKNCGDDCQKSDPYAKACRSANPTCVSCTG